MKNKILKQMVTVLISFLIVFIVIPMTASANSTAGLFAGKYGKAQIFEVNCSPAYPVANQPFTVSSLRKIRYVSTLKDIDWGAKNDRYVQFEDNLSYYKSIDYPAGYTVKLNLYEANGTLVNFISLYGTVWGLNADGFFYKGKDYLNYFISNTAGYDFGSPALTYTPTSGLVTNIADLNSYAANTTVLGVGQTVAGNAAIATAKGLMPTSITVTEGADANLLNYLNAISGMSATGVTLTLQSNNANVANTGAISYTSSVVNGNITVKINKTGGTEVSQPISVTVPAHNSSTDEVNAAIAAAKVLLPATFTATEGTTTNLLTDLNAIQGMIATGTTLTLDSANANVTNTGIIRYTSSAVTGDITVKINKTGGFQASQTIAVTVPAHTVTAAELANAAIAAAQQLMPARFTAQEGTTTNLLTYLNAITGMSATGTTLTLESDNAHVANNGTISYTASEVIGNITVKINKTNGTEVRKIIAVTVCAQKQHISGDYVLIVNESLTENQNWGTISFDDATPFGTPNAMKSLSVNEEQYQQMDTADVLGSSDAMQGLSANENVDQQPLKDDLIVHSLATGAPATKTYIIGETKTLVYSSNQTFTVRGIGAHCVVWMDAAAYASYTPASLDAGMVSVINTYENYCYPALQTLGADTKMNYADGSGKMSIFIQGVGSSPYFSYYDMNYDSITGTHISGNNVTDFDGYAEAIAHEGQHALNASTVKLTSWINEGLSIAIMHDLSYKKNNYTYDQSLQWLFQCVQDISVRSGAGLAHSYYTKNSRIDYSIPYLYLRYLSDQVNVGYQYDSDFFSKFYCVEGIPSGLNGISRDAYIIEQVLKQYDCFKNPDGSHWSFQQSFENFRIAAFKRDATGIYGFNGDTLVQNKIGGAPLYFNACGKPRNIEPTGAVIVKTIDGSFDIPYDAGANIKFIPFNVAGTLPPYSVNELVVGGEINIIYNDRPITFEDLRIVRTYSSELGEIIKIYKGLAELYDDGLTLVAYDPNNPRTPIHYTRGQLPNIPSGSDLGIGTMYNNSFYYLIDIGKAIVKDTYVDPQTFFTVLDAGHSLLTFKNDNAFPWIGSTSTSPTYVMSDFKNATGETSFTATITIPKNTTAKLKFDWTCSAHVDYSQMDFFINNELKKSITDVGRSGGTYLIWNPNTYDLSGGDAGTKYTFKWKFRQWFIVNGLPNAGYVSNIVITDLVQQLQSITAPTAITDVANGTAKTAAALGLPSTVTMVTSGSNVSASVTWNVAGASYNVATKTKQTFTVNGTVTLPDGVVNTKNVDLKTSISVTINAASAGATDECFIATAAFGSKFQPAVVLLRHFRDQYLLTNSIGTAFVKFYYHNSPPIANYIAGNEGLKGMTRILLLPFVAVVYLIYNPLVAVLLFMLLVAVVFIKRRRLDAIR